MTRSTGVLVGGDADVYHHRGQLWLGSGFYFYGRKGADLTRVEENKDDEAVW